MPVVHRLHRVRRVQASGTNTVQFGDIFNDLAIDGAGNLYVVGAGYVGTTPFATTANLYLFKSTAHGHHLERPEVVGSDQRGAHAPGGGRRPPRGQLAIGYFRTVNGVTNPNDNAGKWTYATAESTNATAANASFIYRDVKPGFVYHDGQICNAGVLCGAPGEPSDRSLLDFTSAALDTHGCPLFTFAGNPGGDSNGTSNYVTRQLTGCFSTTAAKKPTTKKKTKPKHHKPAKRRPSRRPAPAPSFTG